MIFEFHNYKFETDKSNSIHVYEISNKGLKYYDFIKNNPPLQEDIFKYKCKCWYSENILYI